MLRIGEPFQLLQQRGDLFVAALRVRDHQAAGQRPDERHRLGRLRGRFRLAVATEATAKLYEARRLGLLRAGSGRFRPEAGICLSGGWFKILYSLIGQRTTRFDDRNMVYDIQRV